MAPNVRLQARAARGVSLCKPQFGGTRPRRLLAQKLQTTKTRSLYYPVGAQKDGAWNGQAKCLGVP